MNGREVSRHTSVKRANAETQRNQMVESADRHLPPRQQKSGKEQWQQRRRERRLKNDFMFNLRL